MILAKSPQPKGSLVLAAPRATSYLPLIAKLTDHVSLFLVQHMQQDPFPPCVWCQLSCCFVLPSVTSIAAQESWLESHV
jgi:hypothetical protein